MKSPDEPSTAATYDLPCEYCDGWVRPRRLAREVFRHRDGFVILEDPVVGQCDRCGRKYYSAQLLRRVEEVATGKTPADRCEQVPVAMAR